MDTLQTNFQNFKNSLLKFVNYEYECIKSIQNSVWSLFVLFRIIAKIKTIVLADDIEYYAFCKIRQSQSTDINKTLHQEFRDHTHVFKTDVELWLIEKEYLLNYTF